jgi:hypothetical protein
MLDEYSLGVPFLTGTLILVSLFIVWYSRVDPMVSLHLVLVPPPRAYPFNFLSLMPFPPWDSAIIFSHTYPLTILTSEMVLSC